MKLTRWSSRINNVYVERFSSNVNASLPRATPSSIGWVDPLSAASLRASGIEFGWVPFDERAGSDNSGTVSIADQSISGS